MHLVYLVSLLCEPPRCALEAQTRLHIWRDDAQMLPFHRNALLQNIVSCVKQVVILAHICARPQ